METECNYNGADIRKEKDASEKAKLISIIVPVYNAVEYLDRCVQSILAQAYRNIELVLINDGSTDGSLEACMAYRTDPRVTVIDKENGGVGSARNEGLKHASGNYILFVDADDYLDVSMCGLLLSEALEKQSDMVFCGYNEFDFNGNITKIDEEQSFNEFIAEKDIGYLFNYNPDCRIGSYIWRILYKADLLTDLHFEEDLFIGEDDIFLVRAVLKAEKISYCNEHLYNYLQIGTLLGYKKYKARPDFYLKREKYCLLLESILKADHNDRFADAARGRTYLDMVSSVCLEKNALKHIKDIKKKSSFYRSSSNKKYCKCLIKTQKNLTLSKRIQILLCFYSLPLYVLIYKILRRKI